MCNGFIDLQYKVRRIRRINERSLKRTAEMEQLVNDLQHKGQQIARQADDILRRCKEMQEALDQVEKDEG